MALKVSEVLKIDDINKMRLVAGGGGLDKIVASVNVADYEFADGFDVFDYDADTFEEDAFVISSLLFAHHHPEYILPAVKVLYNYKVSVFAYKTIFFDELPQEVIDFANEHDFPIFAFGEELHFEDVIYRIVDAVKSDDDKLLSKERLRLMIENKLSRFEVEQVSKGISLLFKPYARGVYLARTQGELSFDTERFLRYFYRNKSQKSKAIMCKYEKGFFLILTSRYPDEEKFDLILREILDSRTTDLSEVEIYKSNIHPSYDELDKCFRESYHVYIASRAAGRKFDTYNQIGTYKYLIPQRMESGIASFYKDLLAPIMEKEDIFQTVLTYVYHNGDVLATADALNCHKNTIRYRVQRAKELAGLSVADDMDFYEQISTAVKIYQLNNI